VKVEYNGLKFDSQLEVDYYKYLKEKGLYFVYHPKIGIETTQKNKYYPDFVVYYGDVRCEIVETKGYSQFSFMKDNMIHNIMQSKTEQELKDWLRMNGLRYDYPTRYRKIKYLKAYGFVDWDFKNPNTIANKRKEKITDLNAEVKELKEFKKNMLRYLTYHKKIVENQKLTKSQKEWYYNYVNEINKLLEENK
jgi:hypothetical protein